jgi:hypothetical protein
MVLYPIKINHTAQNNQEAFKDSKYLKNTFIVSIIVAIGLIAAHKIIFFAFLENHKVDDMLLRLTVKHWRKKFSHMKQEDFDLQIRSRKHVCKHHTKGYQNKVLEKWHNTIDSILSQKESI